MSQFATPLELATYMGDTDEDTTLADLDPTFVHQANLLLELISADIEAAAGVPIESGSTIAVLAGTWSRDLELPAGPIRNVSAVTVNGLALSPAEYFWNDRHILRRGVEPTLELDDAEYADDWSTYARQGASWRAGRHWGGPVATILVAEDFGFEAIPDVIRSLTLRIASRTIGNVDDVTQESLAIYSVTYRSRGDDAGSHVSKIERQRLRQMLNRTGGTIIATGA